MRIKNENFTSKLSSTNMTETITGPAIWLGHIANYAIQLVFTGTPNGAFKLQASCDAPKLGNESETVPTNWTDLAESSTAIDAAGNHLFVADNVGYNFVRIVWTNASSGNPSTITVAQFNVKGV